MMKISITIITLIFCVSANISRANLITNGDFSDNNVSNGSYLYAPDVVANGWSFNAGTGVTENASVWSGIAQTNTLAFLKTDAVTQIATVSQTFIAQNNATFNIAFDLADRNGYGELSVNVILNGAIINQTPLNALSSDNYTHFTFNEVLGSSTGINMLSFKVLNPTNINDSNVFLDNVRVIGPAAITATVPEPDMVAMLFFGLSLIGFFRHRRV